MINEILIKKANEIASKLEWGKRAGEKINAKIDNQIEVQDNFWTFLASFQQAWFYFGKCIEEIFPNHTQKERNILTKNTINNWKQKELTKEEKEAWEILQNLRNKDTHHEPISPNYEIKYQPLLTGNGDYIICGSGERIVIEEFELFVIYENNKYAIHFLIQNGTSSVEKLIDFIKNIDISEIQ